MNKFKKAVFAVTLAVAVLGGSVFAQSTQAIVMPSVQVGVVQGLVSKPDNTAAVGASVAVTCNGNTLNATADASGFYFVQYGNGVCTAGQGVTVNATLGGLSGSNTGTMNAAGYTDFLKLDVAIVHVPLVPEFGLITGAIALVTSAGSMLILKKRV